MQLDSLISRRVERVSSMLTPYFPKLTTVRGLFIFMHFPAPAAPRAVACRAAATFAQSEL